MTTSAFEAAPSTTHGNALFLFLRREWPYILMIFLSLAGVSYCTVFPEFERKILGKSWRRFSA